MRKPFLKKIIQKKSIFVGFKIFSFLFELKKKDSETRFIAGNDFLSKLNFLKIYILNMICMAIRKFRV